MTATIVIPSTATVATLALANWLPDPASVAVSERGELVVALRTGDGRRHERSFPVEALRPPHAGDRAGALVLHDEHGERLVLSPKGTAAELMLFADALAAARGVAAPR